MRRRSLIFAGAAALIWGFQRLNGPRTGRLELVPHPEVRGFSVIAGSEGQISLGAADPLFIGLSPARPPTPPEIEAYVQENPVAALFGEVPSPVIAYFTDIRCPICRTVEADLDRLRSEQPDLQVVTHEHPVFGDGSERAARALLAAGPELRTRLRQRLQRIPAEVTEPFLISVLESLEVDPEPILAAMTSAEVTRALDGSRALADLLGFVGTPALVINRTAILGARSIDTYRQVLSMPHLSATRLEN